MSSRPQSALFADKENSTHAAPSRKAPGMVLAPQNLLKTPNAKHLQNQGVRTAKASSSKQIHYLASNKAYKGVGAATIALEPGARILGAKDGNNRSGLTSRAQSYAGKGKGKALDSVYEDCSLMSKRDCHVLYACVLTGKHSPASIKHPPATKTRSLSGSHKAEKQLRVTATSPPSKPSRIHKTPAKVNRESAALFATTPAATQETPPLGAPKASQRASPRPNSFFSVLSAFKTPSPNQLLRRRKGAGSPVPLHFNPTSLRGDDSGNDLPDSKPPKPTLLEELDAQHAAIDDLQDVDCATRQAIDPAGMESQCVLDSWLISTS